MTTHLYPCNKQITIGALYRLMSWFSPNYPIGAFNYSHGVEYAVNSGLINNAKDLQKWIEGIIEFGTGRLDAILFKTAYEVVKSNIPDGFQELDRSASGERTERTFKYVSTRNPDARQRQHLKGEGYTANTSKEFDNLISISNALKPSPEIWNESYHQGEAALKILLATYHSSNIGLLHRYLKKMNMQPTVAVVLGIASSDGDIPLEAALIAFLYSFVNNLVFAGVKLIPLGQTEGQNIMMNLESAIHMTALCAIGLTIEDIGSSIPMVEWTSVKHETQYTRLFQS